MKIKELLKIIDNDTEIRITAEDSKVGFKCYPNDKIINALRDNDIEKVKSSCIEDKHYIEIFLKDSTENEQLPPCNTTFKILN